MIHHGSTVRGLLNNGSLYFYGDKGNFCGWGQWYSFRQIKHVCACQELLTSFWIELRNGQITCLASRVCTSKNCALQQWYLFSIAVWLLVFGQQILSMAATST